MDWMVAVAGAATGLLVGLSGVGSGALMTPLLLLVFGVAPLTAVGTDLWFAAVTKLPATRIHHGHGLIDWQVVRRLWATEAERFKSLQGPLTVAAGALRGVLVTMTSVGGGALGAMMLVYLYPLRLAPPRLVATDIVHAIPLALFAGIGHLVIRNVNFALLGNLLEGSIPGVIARAMLSARLPHAVLRTVVAAVLLLIGLRLAWATMQ